MYEVHALLLLLLISFVKPQPDAFSDFLSSM